MLTTAEKLHNKSMDSDIINPSIQGIPNLDYKEMYTHTSPADYMMSLFGNTTLEDDLKKYNDDKENKNYGVVQIRMYCLNNCWIIYTFYVKVIIIITIIYSKHF